MKATIDPIGIENDKYITETAKRAGIVVCAWGNHGSYINRSTDVRLMLQNNEIDYHCLKVTKSGEPSHPLYLRKDLTPIQMKIEIVN